MKYLLLLLLIYVFIDSMEIKIGPSCFKLYTSAHFNIFLAQHSYFLCHTYMLLDMLLLKPQVSNFESLR